MTREIVPGFQVVVLMPCSMLCELQTWVTCYITCACLDTDEYPWVFVTTDPYSCADGQEQRYLATITNEPGHIMTENEGLLPAEKEYPAVLVLLFAVLAYFPIFLHLDVLPLRIWDEARNAISAYEMYESGNLLVAHYEGAPDMWGVKPPMLLWFQTFFFHILGPGELAVRLPSALAALFVGWVLFRFCWRELGRPWLGLLACGVLYTSVGFINMHGARSGDHDTLLVFFMCWSLWSIYTWCEHGRRKDLLAFFILLALATLTKSLQALLFLPGIAAYLIADRKLIVLLKERWTYLGLVIFLIMVASFYLAREAVNPGYLEAVWDNEIWGRYTDVLEGHRAPWDRYINLIILRDLVHFYLWVPAGALLGLLHNDQRIRRWTRLLIFIFLGYLLIVSNSSTKLDWYVAPMIPLLAGLVAIAMYVLINVIIDLLARSGIIRTTRSIIFLLFFLLFATPWSEIVARNYHPKEWPWEEEYMRLSYYLKDAIRGFHGIDANVIVFVEHYAHLLFYVHLLNEKGHDLEIRSIEQLKPGDKVLTSQWHARELLEQAHPTRLLWENENLFLQEILDPDLPQANGPEHEP